MHALPLPVSNMYCTVKEVLTAGPKLHGRVYLASLLDLMLRTYAGCLRPSFCSQMQLCPRVLGRPSCWYTRNADSACCVLCMYHSLMYHTIHMLLSLSGVYLGSRLSVTSV